MSATPLKQRLAAGEVTIGSWITLGHPSIAEILARAGFDWLILDTEHSVLSTADVQALVRAIEPSGCTPLVRVADNDPTQIKRVLDAGARGIMVPMVTSGDDARRAVAAAYYPPKGNRGVGLARAQGYGATFDHYRDSLDDQTIVIAMIEHVDAVEAIDEILSVSGVDGYIVGPYDLSASLGIPGSLDDPRIAALLARIGEAGARHAKPGGMHVVEPDTDAVARLVDDGFRFIGYSMDIRLLDVHSRDALATLLLVRRRRS